MAVLFLLSCKKEKTVWESEWSAPLINDTLTLNNLVNDSTLFDDNGVYSLSLNRTLFDFDVSEVLSIPDTTIIEEFIPSLTLPISAGVSFVNSIEEHELNIPDVELKKIILKKGFIDVRLENPVPTKTLFTIVLPGVYKDGLIFSQDFQAPAKNGGGAGVVNETVSLAGYEIDLTGVNGAEYNILQSQIDVKTDPDGPDITLSTSDITKVNATFRDVKIDYARGYFGNEIISDTSTNVIETLSNIAGGSVDLPNSIIRFEIENGIKVNASAKLTFVTNENSNGDEVALTSTNIGANFNINSATGSWNTLSPSLKIIEFNSTNSNMEAYLENLGAIHDLGYAMELNPWGNVSGSWDELFPNSRLRIGMSAEMPINIGLHNLIVKDTFEVALNQNPDKTKVKSGELVLEMKNAFPFSAKIKIHFADENGGIINTVEGSHDISSSLMGEYDAQSGLEIANSNVRFILTEDILENINDIQKIIIESEFNSYDPSTSLIEQVTIPVGAYLGVKLKTKFISENIF